MADAGVEGKTVNQNGALSVDWNWMQLVAGKPETKPQEKSDLVAGKTNHVNLPDGRKYDIYVPSHANGPLPVMMILHGANGGAADGLMERESGMDKLAEEKGFAVVYPLSKTHPVLFGTMDNATWNGPFKNLMATDSSYNDFNYLDSVVQDVTTKHALNVDKDRISAVGMSDGGRLVNEYAAARPGVLSAIASVHGTLLGGEAKTAQGQPTLIIHSDYDYMLPYNGGRGFMSSLSSGIMPGTDSSKPYRQREYWAIQNGCKGLPAVEDGDKLKVTTYTDAQCQVGPVKEYIIKGGKHAWDGVLGQGGWPMVGDKDANFETSKVVADFVLQYRASGKSIKRNLADQLK
jgi:poly(3-hydroxybutyrate) depolymerase